MDVNDTLVLIIDSAFMNGNLLADFSCLAPGGKFGGRRQFEHCTVIMTMLVSSK